MARCEDFPCCGHESGCCPDYDESGQTSMVCTCGARLPAANRFSICDSCLDGDCEDDWGGHEPDEDEYPDREYCEQFADDE